MVYIDETSLTALGVVLPVLGLVAFILRTESQRRYSKGMSADYAVLIPAFLLVVGIAAAIVTAARMKIFGAPPPSTTTSATVYVKLTQFEWAIYVVIPVATGLIKLSILCFFRRIFRGVARWTAFDYTNWTLIGLDIASMVVFFFSFVFVCGTDPEALWGPAFWEENKCVDTLALLLAMAAVNFALDVAILIEPIVIVNRLQLNWRKKIQASLIFLISGLAVAGGLVKLAYFIQIFTQGAKTPVWHEIGLVYPLTDQQPIITIGIFWTFFEVALGFIVACLIASVKVLDSILDLQFFHKLGSILTRSSHSDKSINIKQYHANGIELGDSSSRSSSRRDHYWEERSTGRSGGTMQTATSSHEHLAPSASLEMGKGYPLADHKEIIRHGV